MNTRPALFELLETRRLMSATCMDVLAAEPSEPQLLLPAAQKVREAAARIDVGSFQGGVRVAAGDVNKELAQLLQTAAELFFLLLAHLFLAHPIDVLSGLFEILR